MATASHRGLCMAWHRGQKWAVVMVVHRSSTAPLSGKHRRAVLPLCFPESIVTQILTVQLGKRRRTFLSSYATLSESFVVTSFSVYATIRDTVVISSVSFCATNLDCASSTTPVSRMHRRAVLLG